MTNATPNIVLRTNHENQKHRKRSRPARRDGRNHRRFICSGALAKESAHATATADAIRDVADNTLQGAKQANHEAASQAAKSLASENWIDLDIRFDDRTSMLVAVKK
jgi:hypothetical protein